MRSRSVSPARMVERAYRIARERYAELGLNTDQVLAQLATKSLSLHCWQGDDVTGFEPVPQALAGGIQVTGNYPGRARNSRELRQDIETALSLIPGRHRVNLHAIYGDFPARHFERNHIAPEHFRAWVDWAQEQRVGVDFNATLFSHPKASSGFTLSSPEKAIREFWIEHVIAARAIAAHFGRRLGTTSIHNLWIPDGMKDHCVDRAGFRTRLVESLDRIYARRFSAGSLKDSVESKLFGIGSESFVVGSHELYLGYAITRKVMPCLDLGHFHPTEAVSDKISSILQFCPELLLHLSRGVRWDSDHVVVFDDTLREVAGEIVRSRAWTRVHLALDYFDASVNRVAAWVIGARAVLRALLAALLEPGPTLEKLERRQSYGPRLALMEASRNMPLGAVWDYYCLTQGHRPEGAWYAEIIRYEQEVLNLR